MVKAGSWPFQNDIWVNKESDDESKYFWINVIKSKGSPEERTENSTENSA